MLERDRVVFVRLTDKEKKAYDDCKKQMENKDGRHYTHTDIFLKFMAVYLYEKNKE